MFTTPRTTFADAKTNLDCFQESWSRKLKEMLKNSRGFETTETILNNFYRFLEGWAHCFQNTLFKLSSDISSKTSQR